MTLSDFPQPPPGSSGRLQRAFMIHRESHRSPSPDILQQDLDTAWSALDEEERQVYALRSRCPAVTDKPEEVRRFLAT